MEAKYKILLVDDDADLLDLFKEVLQSLPSQPEVLTADAGSRALTILEDGNIHLIITDLKMPRMDGLQVLSIVRKQYPNLRTVVLTSVADEQFRSRVYALGVDLFWQKPANDREIAMFRDSIQSLLEREDRPGFRGVQSKSLMDIIQLECLTQSSSVLRITNGPLVGRIWINQGELHDAEAGSLKGEEAFQHILSWKSGNFEVLPAEPDRPRVIQVSYNALLLESVQAIDEARGGGGETDEPAAAGARPRRDPMAAMEGFEFLVALRPGEAKPAEARGIENPAGVAAWTRKTLERFRAIGDSLHVGQPDTIVGLGLQQNLCLTQHGGNEFCIGWRSNLDAPDVRKSSKKVAAIWAS
jgi:CheY-like chemotaxis protein